MKSKRISSFRRERQPIGFKSQVSTGPSYHTVKVEGTWELPQGELALTQTFQMISGTLRSGNVSTPTTNGRLNGDQISFTAGGNQYTGYVNGNVMAGNVSSGGSWKARHASK
jgi:hypothetical protein